MIEMLVSIRLIEIIAKATCDCPFPRLVTKDIGGIIGIDWTKVCYDPTGDTGERHVWHDLNPTRDLPGIVFGPCVPLSFLSLSTRQVRLYVKGRGALNLHVTDDQAGGHYYARELFLAASCGLEQASIWYGHESDVVHC